MFRSQTDFDFLGQVTKEKLTPLVEGNPKDPFSIATTLRCR